MIFGGRLGEYKYFDMDAVIASSLELCEKRTWNESRIVIVEKSMHMYERCLCTYAYFFATFA